MSISPAYSHFLDEIDCYFSLISGIERWYCHHSRVQSEYDLLYGLSSWVNTNFSTDPKVIVGAPMLKKEINSNTKNEIGSTYLIFNCGWKVNYWVYYLRFYR